MLLLAIETSSSLGSCAACRDGLPLSESRWSRAAGASNSHSEAATAEIERVVARADVSLSDFDALAVGTGPGSFTGIRVALNAAKALAYALAKPVYAFDACEILAEGAPRTRERLLTLVEAHRDLVYVSAFSSSEQGEPRRRLLPVQAIRAGELSRWLDANGSDEGWICVGAGRAAKAADAGPEALARLGEPLSNEFDFPSAAALARLAERARADGDAAFDWKSVQPLYVRASEAEETLGRRLP